MDRQIFAMSDNEHLLGKWSIAYLPPAGGKYPGQLRVTNRRVVFIAEVKPDCLERTVSGPIDGEAVACALDLGWGNVTYDGSHLLISIPASQIEYVMSDDWLLNHCLSLTIKNNGSIHQFEKGLLPVGGIVRAIRQAVRVAHYSSASGAGC